MSSMTQRIPELIATYSVLLGVLIGFYYVYTNYNFIIILGISVMFTLYLINFYITPFLLQVATFDMNNPIPECTTITQFTNEVSTKIENNTTILTENTEKLNTLLHNFKIPSMSMPSIELPNLIKDLAGEKALNEIKRSLDVISMAKSSLTDLKTQISNKIIGDSMDITYITDKVNDTIDEVNTVKDSSSSANESKNTITSYPKEQFALIFLKIILFPNHLFEWIFAILIWATIYFYTIPVSELGLYLSTWIYNPLGLVCV